MLNLGQWLDITFNKNSFVLLSNTSKDEKRSSMKFLVAKNDNLFCFHCSNQILRNEHYTGVFFKDRNGFRRRLIFHVVCYCNWQRDNTYKKYEAWKAAQVEPKKRGRPKKYRDGKTVNRLCSLLHYYEKLGNKDKVKELKASIEECKY